MKNRALIITIISTALFATGRVGGQTASQDLEKAKIETKEAAHDMEAYTFAEKDKFTRKMQAKLAEINRDLDRLDAKIEKAGDAGRGEAKSKLHALRVEADHLGKQLEAARNATESDWDRVKADSKKSYDELRDGVNRARQWVSDKIAP